MADELSMALDELLRKAQVSTDVDFLREGVRALAEALMELEVTHHVGAGRYERTPERTGERNGTRERHAGTARGNGAGIHRGGSIALRVPRVRDGSYFPSLSTWRWESPKTHTTLDTYETVVPSRVIPLSERI